MLLLSMLNNVEIKHLPNPSSSTNGAIRQSSLSVISSGWLWCTEKRLCKSKLLKNTINHLINYSSDVIFNTKTYETFPLILVLSKR